MREIAVSLTVTAILAIQPVAGDPAAPYERNWPQWRGPLGTGRAPYADPPARWDEATNIRWKIELPGKGLSSPIVWEDLVFVTTAIPATRSNKAEDIEQAERNLPEWRRRSGIAPERVIEFAALAVDRDSGRIRWRRILRTEAPHEGTHADGSWASNSPVTDGRVLIAHFGSSGTYGLDLDGNLLWERDLGQMTTRHGFGEGSSPALDGDTVVINWDHEGPSFMVALNSATGKDLWRVERDEVTSWSTPIVVKHAGRRQVIVNATGRTRGYDLSTGDLLWEAGGMTVNTIPSPVATGSKVYVTSGFRGSTLQAIDLASAAGDITGSRAVLWSHDRDTPYVPSPLLSGGRLYFLKLNTAILSVLDAQTGEPSYPPKRLEEMTGVYASPVAAEGRVYIVGRNGLSYVLSDGPEFRVQARNSLDDRFDASPAMAGGDLFLRGRRNLYCIAQDPQSSTAE